MYRENEPVAVQEPLQDIVSHMVDNLNVDMTKDVLDAAVESLSSPPTKKRDSFLQRTITIFDWDDTLLASTCLASLGLRINDTVELAEPLKSLLEELEVMCVSILQEASRHGVVQIITNAENGWIELSGRRFLPKVVEFIEKENICVVSARSNYEAQYPNSPTDWKTQAFGDQVEKAFPNHESLNILVLGDSMSEREAAHALALKNPLSRVKTVKFVERPNIEQLHRQISLVHSSFVDLCDHDGSFDVNLVC